MRDPIRIAASVAMLAIIGVPVAFGAGLTFWLAMSAPSQALWQQPGFDRSVMLTIVSGLGSTALALFFAAAAPCVFYGGKAWRALQRLLPLWLAIPHAATAVGVLFLFAPSGWLVRALAEPLGLTRPPSLSLVQDPYGLALMLGLALKETPFLLLTLNAALAQINLRQTLLVGRSLGYGPTRVWVRLVLPQLYPQMRLPLLIVLAYAVSAVEMALILAPSVPGTMAQRALSALTEPELVRWQLGAQWAFAIVLLLVVALLVGLLLERLLPKLLIRRICDGRRTELGLFSWLGNVSWMVWVLIASLCLFVLMAWSGAARWRFPDLLPTWTLLAWQRAAEQGAVATYNSLWLGLAAAGLALIMAVILLEALGQLKRWQLAILYLPLLLPQLTFLAGAQYLWLQFFSAGQAMAVLWGHILFVLPYVLLALYGPWQRMDTRFLQAARSLGATRLTALLRVRLPMMAVVLASAFALGFAVSIGQYLSTFFLGAGRWPTLTTEAVALSSGGNRRVLAVQALLQTLLPWMVFALGLYVPRLVYRNRRGVL